MPKHFRLILGLVLTGCATLPAQSISSITISTVPQGARFYVDGLPYVAAQVFLWPQGSKHIVQFPTDTSNGVSTGCQVSQDNQYRWCFGNWTDSTGVLTPSNATDQTVTASPSVTFLQANLTVNYKVRVRFGNYPTVDTPNCAAPGNAPQDISRPGLLWVGGACFQSGSDIWGVGNLALNAFPYPGFVFTGWDINGQTFDSYLKSYVITGPVTIYAGFQSAKRVQFLTSPPGLQLLIDRTATPTAATLSLDYLSGNFPPCQLSLNLPPMPPITIPALCFGEFDMLPGSRHVIGATSPQIDNTGKYWVFDQFSNGLGANSVYVPDANTSQGDVITANFVPAVQEAFLTNPAGLKLNIDGRDNWPNYNFIWAANSTHTVIAPATQTDSNGRTWTFQGWSNGGPPTQSVLADLTNPNQRFVATYTALGLLKITTNPPGIHLLVAGSDCVTPCSTSQSSGTQVSIVAPASIPIDSSSRLDFLGWSDGATATRKFTLNGDVQSVFANYGYSYRLALASDPDGGANFTLSPPSSDLFYPTDSPVAITVTARSGFRFRRWGGDLAGVYNVGQVTMSGPRSVIALLDRIPYIAPAGVKNSVGATPDGTVAPGSIISIYGESLAPAFVVGPQNPLAQTISDVVVTVGDRILPLLFVSPQQINAQMISDLPDGDYTLTVHWTGMPDVNGTFTVSRDAPGLFSRGVDPNLYAMAAHEDGTPVTPDSPAKKGELLTLYGTGFGPYNQRVIDGFSVPASSTVVLIDPIEVDAAGQPIQPEWSGGAPGLVGLNVTKFRLPDATPSANVDLLVKVNGKASNTVSLPVQ